MGLIKPVLFSTLPNRITVHLIQLYTMHVVVVLYIQRRRIKTEERAKVVATV